MVSKKRNMGDYFSLAATKHETPSKSANLGGRCSLGISLIELAVLTAVDCEDGPRCHVADGHTGVMRSEQLVIRSVFFFHNVEVTHSNPSFKKPAEKPKKSELELLTEQVSFEQRDLQPSYEHVQPLGAFWRILGRRSSGDLRRDLLENKRLQLPLKIPDTIVFDKEWSKPCWYCTLHRNTVYFRYY